nr:immunoglobulin heavy chain junction region [Mus musculus]
CARSKNGLLPFDYW